MFYLTIRARNERGAVIYEKDADPGVFSPVGSHLRSILCRQNLMMECEQYCLHVCPRFEGVPQCVAPQICTVSGPDVDWNRLYGTNLVVEDRSTWNLDTPVCYFVFLLFTQSRRCCRWDVFAGQLDYVGQTVEQALLKGGYLASPGNLRCDFLVREAERPTYDERILLADEGASTFQVSPHETPDERFPLRELADFARLELLGEEPLPGAPLTIFDHRVLDKILRAAQEGETRREEVAGLLLGQPYRSAGSPGLLVYVRDLIPAMSAPATPASVRFTVNVLEKMNEDKNAHFQHETKVGWYHSHPAGCTSDTPGGGPDRLFFSDADWRVHRQFREPWHLALVVTGSGKQAAIFHWVDRQCSEITRCRGFYVHSAQDPAASAGQQREATA